MDLDVSIFLCENIVFMSVWVIVISLGITTTRMDIEVGLSQKYGAVQVHFGKVVCCGRSRDVQ